MVSLEYYTDPLCPWSWAMEPAVRKLMVEFGEALDWTFVMGGLARDLARLDPGGTPLKEGAGRNQVYARLTREWLEAADRSEMPLDPLLWSEAPLVTSYPACMGVEAAKDQAPDGGYRFLRRLREGLICGRRRLDHAEALVEEARAAGLDVERFRLDLRSNAIIEALAADLDRTKAIAAVADPAGAPCSRTQAGAPLPTLAFGGGEEQRTLSGFQSYEFLREAALACGAEPEGTAPPSVEQLFERFRSLTEKEVEVVCELPGPRAGAELFRLSERWQVRQRRCLNGYIFEAG